MWASGYINLNSHEIFGWYEGSRSGAYLVSPFRELHLRHKICRFDITVDPPADNGTMWSTVKSLVVLQMEQKGCNVRNSFDNLRHSAS
jgi:hypothetical protein